MARYVLIDEAQKKCVNGEEGVRRPPGSIDGHRWTELDERFEGYLWTEAIVADDLSVSPDVEAKTKREKSERNLSRFSKMPSVQEQLYALWSDRQGDSRRLTAVDDAIAAVVASDGEPE